MLEQLANLLLWHYHLLMRKQLKTKWLLNGHFKTDFMTFGMWVKHWNKSLTPESIPHFLFISLFFSFFYFSKSKRNVCQIKNIICVKISRFFKPFFYASILWTCLETTQHFSRRWLNSQMPMPSTSWQTLRSRLLPKEISPWMSNWMPVYLFIEIKCHSVTRIDLSRPICRH